MSQLIACKSKNGLVLGVDSKAIDVDQHGNLIELKVDRMHQLSEYAVILNGGAASGEQMCDAIPARCCLSTPFIRFPLSWAGIAIRT